MATYTVTVSANAFGNYVAKVETSHTLSFNEDRPELNAARKWDYMRSIARKAIMKAILDNDMPRDSKASDVSLKLELVEVIDPMGRNFGSGLMDGAVWREAA